MDMERFAYITIVILASFGLGFWLGNAHATSKYVRKQRKLARRVQVLENFKHAVKVLCPKIKSENTDDEDTETGELKVEKVTRGHPDDA